MFVAGLVDRKGSKSPWRDSNASFLQRNPYNERNCGIMHQILNTPMTIPIINLKQVSLTCFPAFPSCV